MINTNGYAFLNLSNLTLSSDSSYLATTGQYSFPCNLKEYGKIDLKIGSSLLTETQIANIAANGELGYNLAEILGAGAVVVMLNRVPRGGGSTSFKSEGEVKTFDTLENIQSILDTLIV